MESGFADNAERGKFQSRFDGLGNLNNWLGDGFRLLHPHVCGPIICTGKLEIAMTTILIIVLLVILFGGGGFYGRGRWW
jgi:hypothetical protein